MTFVNSTLTHLAPNLFSEPNRNDALRLEDSNWFGKRDVAITIYGIKNCDTMAKARAWLDKRGIAYAFHDYRTDGIDRARLEGWAKAVGWEILLNRASTTFRALPEASREGLTEKKAIALMLDRPTMIKRPVLDLGGKFLVGFKPAIYEAALS
jgi:arsenate reductase (glutaredoxin)